MLSDLIRRFEQALIFENRYMNYINGLKITLILAFFSILLGVIIGIIVASAKVGIENKRKHTMLDKIIIKICDIYITVIRGTPVVVQLMVFSGLIFTSRNTNEVFVGIICFGINSGAYVAEIIRAGITSVDRGQMEAGRSLGLSTVTTMRYIILPQAVKNILPALGNEFIVLIKETAIVSFIGVTDLFQGAQYISTRTYDILPPMIIAASIYLILVLALSKALKAFERRLARSDNR